jgi:hypothetical protein
MRPTIGTGLGVALAVLAGPGGATADELTDGDVGLDVFQGTAIGSVRVVGMGGAATALAEGSSGTLANPAAAAIRSTTSTDWFDWDVHLDGVRGRSGGDLDNDGQRADAGMEFGTVGLVLNFGKTGIGLSTTTSSATIDDGAGGTLEASAADVRVAYARQELADALVVGGGLRWTVFDFVDHSSDEPLTRQHVGLEAGASWQPRAKSVRVGAAIGVPLWVEEATACTIATCGDFILPARLEVPWQASVGVAYRLAPTAWNQWIATKFRDERALTLALETVITGAADDAIGIGALARQDDLRAGGHVTVGVRLGAEHEVLPGRLRLRAGGYWEPGRVDGVGGRIHGTFGLEAAVLNFRFFGPRRVRVSATGDVARAFTNVGLSVGFWH